MKTYTSNSLAEMHNFGEIIYNQAVAFSNAPVFVILKGNLGAGKTSCVQGLAKAAGIKDQIISPTYVIQKEYKIDDGKIFDELIHIDAYRIENKEEFDVIGFKQLKDRKAIIAVEWPENAPDIKGQNMIVINIKVNNEKRFIEVE